jgi:maltose-binding protein MalE
MKKILMFAGVLFLSTAVLTSCGGKDEKKEDKKDDKKEEAKEEEETEEASDESTASLWSQEMKDAYLNSCIGTASSSMGEDVATTYCNCTLEKVIEKYPNPATMGNMDESTITELAAQCLTADMMK